MWHKPQNNFVVPDVKGEMSFNQTKNGLVPKYHHDYIVSQSTEKLDCNGNRLYQGDVVFVENIEQQDKSENTHSLFEIIIRDGEFFLSSVRLRIPENQNEIEDNKHLSYIMKLCENNKEQSHQYRKVPQTLPFYDIIKSCCIIKVGDMFRNSEFFEGKSPTPNRSNK
jgi:hypothetical protein